MGEPFRLGRVLARSFDIWRRQLVVLLALALVVHAPRVAAVEALARLWQVRGGGEGDAWFLPFVTRQLAITLIDALFTGLSVAPVVFAVYARLQGRDARVGESLHGGLRRFLPVLRVSLALAMIAATLSFAAGVAFYYRFMDLNWSLSLFWAVNIGLALLIALVLSPFWVAVPAAVVETPGEGLRRSWRLTRGHRLAVWAILTLLHAINFGARWTLAELTSGDVVAEVLWWTAELLLVSLNAVFAAVGYHALRLEKEGVDVSKLKDVFA